MPGRRLLLFLLDNAAPEILSALAVILCDCTWSTLLQARYLVLLA